MDPVSLIVAAIVAGVASGAQATASTAVSDAYTKLKGLLRRRLAGDAAAEAELERAEQDATANPAPLAEQLRSSGADRDEEVVAAARALLESADPEGARGGKYDVHVSGGKGVVVGDHATTTMNFGPGD
jgi:hypothetical protein